MAIDDLDTLRQQIPEIFADHPLPPGWEDDWLFVPIEDPEGQLWEPVNDVMDYESVLSSVAGAPTQVTSVDFLPDSDLPRFGDGAAFPGAPATHHGGSTPPPDALAFYLPFHYFHPTWWGVYLVLEGVHWLAQQLTVNSSGALSGRDSMIAARIFLYGHEAFHHAVEVFATRLEITHRSPLYREPFERWFRMTFGTSKCVEETLATAYGYRKVKERAFRKPNDPGKRQVALDALRQYIRTCAPGYAEADRVLETRAFTDTRALFAEENHRFALPSIPGCDPAIWHSSPQAFTGLSRVTSRVNYIVQRGSPLAARFRLGLRYLRYGDLARRLRAGGCSIWRQGKGSHEIWRAPNGSKFPVPLHPGDLRIGTLAKIVKQAGFNMSVSEFVASTGTA
ncbi:MAG: type II toxin-antitoxin system HicA family toxin [Candidatus Eiseniibacteriota bacterium]